MQKKTIAISASLILTTGLIKSEKNTQLCKEGVCSIADHQETLSATPGYTTRENGVTELNANIFYPTITATKKPVVVDFYATWCPPCKSIKPIFAELAQEEDWVFCSLNVDQAQSIVSQCKITAMPTFVVFKNGIQWGAIKGALQKEELKKKLRAIIAAPTPSINNEDLMQKLIMAISQRSIPDIKKSIAEGVPVNGTFVTPEGSFSPLQIAIISGNEEIIDLLFASGSIIDKQIQEATEKYLNMLIVRSENFEQNFNYIKNKLSVSKPETSTKNLELGQQFLMAILNPPMLKELIEKKVDINCTFMCGNFEVTPVYLALLLNNKTAIDLLIDAGASISTLITNESGQKKTVFEMAQAEIDKLKKGIIKSKERLHYASSKVRL